VSLFFDDQEWVRLAADEARTIVLRLNAKMVSGEGEASPGFVHGPGDHATSEQDSALPVTAVSRRRLCFYPAGWFVYRLACAIEAIPDLAGYQRLAFAFAVCGPAAADDTCTPIDWKSAPLHGLNESLELDLARLDGDQVREYLMFFCTFIGGEGDSSGAIAPFFLPEDPTVFAWDETLEDFDTLCRRRRLQLFAPVGDPNRGDEFDLPEVAPSAPQGTSPDDGSRRPAPGGADQARAVADAFAAHPRTPSPSTAETQGDATPVPSDALAAEDPGEAAEPRLPPEWTALFDALVWYGSALFVATFSVQRNGVVQMLADKPIAGATSLPVPRWEARRGPADVWLLCRQLKRERVSAAELLQRIGTDIEQRSAISQQTAATHVRLRGLRVDDRLERALVFSGPVRLSDIEFTHDVVLDDSIFERSLELLNCRFLRRLSGRDATVKGALRLDGSRIDGAVEFGASEAGKRQPPVLDLRGLVVDRGLFADRLTTFGRVRGEWIRIGSTVRARGLQIHPRSSVLDGSSALDLSHARINGPLDLAGYVAKAREPGGRQRTLFAGDAKLAGLTCEQADLDGVDVRGSLDLSSCRVSGRLRVGVALVDPDADAWWRARVGAFFSLHRSQIGRVEMMGCRTDGEFHIVDLQLSGSLFADLAGRFRTRIGADLNASGAEIKGDLTIDGAQIGGRFVFITGRLGRLRANVDAWSVFDPSSGRLAAHFCASETQGIVLQAVAIDASIQLSGIQLRQGSGAYGDGSFIADAVRVGGALRFWRAGVSVELLHTALSGVAPMSDLKGGEATTEGERRTDLIDRVRASIPGTLDLTGIRTGGTVDLSRLWVGGAINLSSVHIDGSLVASPQPGRHSCSAAGFRADIAAVGGDVDLRGLLTRSQGLSARDADVNGQLLLASASNEAVAESGLAAPGHALVRDGRLDLEGAKAARTVVSSANIEPGPGSDPRKAAISLARGKFGQLTVLGFEHDRSGRTPSRFPCSIDLSAMSVGDWEIDPQTETLPLLEATVPFDGRNFVDIEHRLAKIGRKDKADEIYRRMLQRGAQGRGRGARFANWLNRAFSGNGTRPLLMFFWIVVAMLPVVCMLRNVDNVEFAGVTTAGHEVRPISNGRPYDLDRDWDWVKAAGLASTYAIPFLAKEDLVRARRTGHVCVDGWPWMATSSAKDERRVSTPALAPGELPCDHGFVVPAAPHSVAMMFSTLQGILWILVAANLPVIARRRP
jgi:hypothetical protein